MNGRQRLVHSGYGPTVFVRQQDEVSVGNLPVPDDSGGWHVEIRSIVRPELILRECGNGLQQHLCRFRRRLHTRAQVKPDKCALGDGACRKSVPLAEPRRSARVQAVFGRRQCDQDIGIQQKDLTLRHQAL